MPRNTVTPSKPPISPETEKIDERNAWGEDQEKHRYYYDDAHGYETYVPADDVDDESAEADGEERQRS